MGIFSNDIMTAAKVRKQLAALFQRLQTAKRVVTAIEAEIKEVQLRCPHEVVNEYDYDPRFIPKKICQDCGAEL